MCLRNDYFAYLYYLKVHNQSINWYSHLVGFGFVKDVHYKYIVYVNSVGTETK